MLKVQEATKEKIIIDTHLLSEEEYLSVRAELVSRRLAKGKKGRGGGLLLSSRKKNEAFGGYSEKKGARKIPQTKEDRTMPELSREAEMVYRLIPQDGASITNRTLRNKLRPKRITTEDFWKYRQELLEKNLIKKERGRGGSVRIIQPTKAKPSEGALVDDEKLLYPKLEQWLKEEVVAPFVSEGGKAWVKNTSYGSYPKESGKWSRPDVTLVRTKRYPSTQWLDFVVTGYEVKPYEQKDDTAGVFEAASHSKYCHECYLVVETLEEELESTDEPPEELVDDLLAFGVGFGWLYRKKDEDTYVFIESLPPVRKQPRSELLDKLMRVFKEKLNKEELTAYEDAIR